MFFRFVAILLSLDAGFISVKMDLILVYKSIVAILLSLDAGFIFML